MPTRTQQIALAQFVGVNGVHFGFGRLEEFKELVLFLQSFDDARESLWISARKSQQLKPDAVFPAA
jgi:hypothetical protein